MIDPGRVVILNGAPRSGKSSIAAALSRLSDQAFTNLGVDVVMESTAADLLPGIGLRPGGERPDLEAHIVQTYASMYDEIAVLSRDGGNVVVDVGHHDRYSRPLGILADAARRLEGVPVLMVGVRCPIEVIVERRAAGGGYLSRDPDGSIAAPVRRWQEAVHDPGIYDLEVDTSVLTPDECAAVILACLRDGPGGTALGQAGRLV